MTHDISNRESEGKKLSSNFTEESIADVWHVGVRVKANEKGIVSKEEVERLIKEVMEGERGNKMRRNSEKWMKLAKIAVDEGGSSDKIILWNLQQNLQGSSMKPENVFINVFYPCIYVNYSFLSLFFFF
jgi:hypothetical protein